MTVSGISCGKHLQSGLTPIVAASMFSHHWAREHAPVVPNTKEAVVCDRGAVTLDSICFVHPVLLIVG